MDTHIKRLKERIVYCTCIYLNLIILDIKGSKGIVTELCFRPGEFHYSEWVTLVSHMASWVKYFYVDDNEDCTFCYAKTYPVIE